MDHTDHVNLLKPADLTQGGTWADFGAGSGAFTLALRDLLGPRALIYAVDKDRGSLGRLETAHRQRFHSTDNLILVTQDFARPFPLLELDGIVMANSLHFLKDKEKVLSHVRGFLRPGGMLLVVEYNVDAGNVWVPYPLSFERLQRLLSRVGFSPPQLLAKRASSFLREFYSARAYKTEND